MELDIDDPEVPPEVRKDLREMERLEREQEKQDLLANGRYVGWGCLIFGAAGLYQGKDLQSFLLIASYFAFWVGADASGKAQSLFDKRWDIRESLKQKGWSTSLGREINTVVDRSNDDDGD